VGGLGWRLVLGSIRSAVAVSSLAQASEVAQHVVRAAGADADAHLRVDLRQDQVQLVVCAAGENGATYRDIELAAAVSAAVSQLGLRTEPGPAGARVVQGLEIAIDAMDIPAIRPFWKAVLGYGDETPTDGPEDPIVDPTGQGASVWFQQMDSPRPQRNRIHLDLSLAHDEAPGRLQAALEAGGLLVNDAWAPSFWVLSDVEGNEVCICTWQGRDEREAAALA
jgi:4a-hydroxytetrahydrobiopterin dehydratase